MSDVHPEVHAEDQIVDVQTTGRAALEGIDLVGGREEYGEPRGITRLTGGQSAFPIAVMFGFALFDAMERAAGQVLTPEIRDAFNLTDAGILGITMIALCVGLLLTIPISFLADRGNRVRIMTIGALIFTFFSILTGLIPTEWWLLLIVRAGAAIGLATILPTHNSLLADFYDIPNRPRVYAVHAWIDGTNRPWPAACHIGPNISFGERTRTVEAHLLDFQGDLYGRRLELDFIERLRPSRAFAGVSDLVEQIQTDVDQTRAVCQAL